MCVPQPEPITNLQKKKKIFFVVFIKIENGVNKPNMVEIYASI